METLDTREVGARWQLIEIAASMMQPRFGLGVAPHGLHEFTIMGGYSQDNDNDAKEGHQLADIHIFDSKRWTTR